jgi:hypothetical protein
MYHSQNIYGIFLNEQANVIITYATVSVLLFYHVLYIWDCTGMGLTTPKSCKLHQSCHHR